MLDPETITSYEIGFKGSFLDDALTLNLAAFDYDYRNLQVARTQSIPGGGFVSQLENAAKSTVRGVELEYIVKPTRTFQLDGFVAYLDATFDDYVTTDPLKANLFPFVPMEQLAGNTLPQSPKWSAKVRATQFLPVVAGLEPRIGVEAQYKSKLYFSPFNDDRLSQDGTTIINADLGLRSETGTWEALFFIRNLTDEKVYIQSFPYSNSLPIAGFMAPPRSYGVSLSYNF